MNKLNLRFQFFLLFLAIIVIALFLFSANNAEARHTLETSYSLANKDWCAPLNFKDNAQYLSNQLSMLTAESASPPGIRDGGGLTLVGTFKNICAPDEVRNLLPWYYQWDFLEC